MKYLKEQRGLTLLETILALGLVLILVAGFTRAMTTGLQSEIEVELRLKASNLASGIIEFLGEGNNLENIVWDNDEKEYIDKIVYIDEDENKLIDVQNGELDSDLLFSGIKRGIPDNSDNGEPDNSDNGENVSQIELIKGFDDNESLYKVKVTIIWDERGNKWTHKLISLLAVD